MKLRHVFVILSIIIFGQSLALGEEAARLIDNISFDIKKCAISYTLNYPSYIRIRIGVTDGPMYGTPVDWEYRSAGRHEENWRYIIEKIPNSLTSDKLNYTINYFTEDDTDKQLVQPDDIAVQPAQLAVGGGLSSYSISQMHKRHDRKNCHEPKIEINTLGDADKTSEGTPMINGSTAIQIKSVENNVSSIGGQFYTIQIFFDNIYIHGELIGYMPYTYYIETGKLIPGVHLITVNIATFDDHIGLGQLLVKVEK